MPDHVPHERLPRKVLAAAALVFDDRGRVLLGRRAYGDGSWDFPGGMVEPGESIVDALQREVREELRARVEILRFAGAYYKPDRDAIVFAFRCRPLDGALTPDGAEIAEAAWFPLDRLPDLHEWQLERIADALADRPPVWRVHRRDGAGRRVAEDPRSLERFR